MWTKLEMRIELLRETKGKSITKEINTQYTAEHNCSSCAPHSVLAGKQNCSPCASKSEKILTKNREGPSQINIEQKCSKNCLVEMDKVASSKSETPARTCKSNLRTKKRKRTEIEASVRTSIEEIRGPRTTSTVPGREPELKLKNPSRNLTL